MRDAAEFVLAVPAFGGVLREDINRLLLDSFVTWFQPNTSGGGGGGLSACEIRERRQISWK